ncbi:hypothetical protein [Sphingomonas sp.]|uniref:hypothetical protein n=1 Tax=Sphingomonas sp. TaxID=28214 RepID=UPI00389C6C0C
MDAGLIQRIETGAERGASALLAAAVAYAGYGLLGTLGVQPEAGVCAAGAGALAYLPCRRLMEHIGSRHAGFDLTAFEPVELDMFEPTDELVLTEADRLRPQDELVLTDADRLDGSEALLLDDILAEIDSDARVVRLFDRAAMPTPGQLQSRIAGHVGASPVEAPADAAQALSDALAELRRSLG